MKKKTVKRIVALVSTAALSAAALVMFAGCTTRHPQVTITYTFNGEDYEVDYTLSRNDAPKTVEHFIELADAGFTTGCAFTTTTLRFCARAATASKTANLRKWTIFPG